MIDRGRATEKTGPDHAPAACPHCGYKVDCARSLQGGDQKAGPGDVTVCLKCAGVSQYTDAMGLVAFDPAVLDREDAALIARARRLIQRGPPPASFPPGYYQAVLRLDRVLGSHLAIAAEAPRFALPAPEVAVIGDVGDIASSIARNASARAFLAKAVDDRTAPEDRPTVMMLRAVLEKRGLAVESVTLGELGLTPLGTKLAGAS